MRVLFVCTGNICRSPSADGVLRKKLADAGLVDVVVDSAGTTAYHVGEMPDSRSITAAAKRGYDLTSIRARKLVKQDFDDFDLLFALDLSHENHMKRMAPAGRAAKVQLLLPYAGVEHVEEVPDPYYGGAAGFEHVLDLLEQACDALVAEFQVQR